MVQNNLYHLLGFIPAVESWEMPPSLERAAQQLVRSGRLRINADRYRNFVRHGTADSDATFTARELTDPLLRPRTRAALARHVPPSAGTDGIDDLLQHLMRELVKARGIEPEQEMKVARVVVQSAHPAVVQLLLESGTEIFVSYAHNVGDLMAVHDWQTHGTASGMQATLRDLQQVFISAGGDPFFEGEHKTYTTDGWPALARMVVIGAQEMGHFADLMRQGKRVTGRYSLSAMALDSRRRDRAHMAHWQTLAVKAGLPALYRAETSLAFYDQRGRFSLPWIYWQLRRFAAWARCMLALRQTDIPRKLSTFPRYRAGTALTLFLNDMEFNLAPMADAYRRDDPVEEEAIACIEAVARVPQQTMKWGAEAVHAAWPHLAPIYDGAVIAGCLAAVAGPLPHAFMPRLQRLTRWWRRAVRPTPDYYPPPPKKREKA